MRLLRRFLDKIHPLFAKGGHLEPLYPLYEAVDTFLFTPADVTSVVAGVGPLTKLAVTPPVA